MRTAIYARVSTTDQSAQMQLDALREHAKHRGLEIVAEHVDHGISGTKDSRPELNKLMDAARKRQLDLVLVYRFDRFARSVKHLVLALEEFQALGVKFVSYAENLDTSTPMGKAMFSIIAALAELERNLIVERSMEGQRRARARGVHVGRPATEVDEDEIRYLKGKGLSVRAIATKLQVGKNVVCRVLRANA
ncbi:MAG: recombinase family protein [Planctomycetota bacterium]